MQPHRYPFGVIGNCSYMAYIDLRGDVGWLCMPRFDGDPVFASMLDAQKGGCFAVVPDGSRPLKQAYLDNTNILCTDVQVDGGAIRITDFAPRFVEFGRSFRPNMLFRRLEVLDGQPMIALRCNPLAAGGARPCQPVQGSNHISWDGAARPMRLTTDLPLSHLMSGERFLLTGTRYLAFTYGPGLEAPLRETAEVFLQKTIDYWHQWVKSTSIPHLFQRQVIRSALVLKLHQFEDTGAIIASGTTSLPEAPGSSRNWDYRYCWLRDSYYTLRAFADIGQFQELENYFHFAQDIAARHPDRIFPLYTIDGKAVPDETTGDFAGYLGNGPVRFGNGANRQLQFDIYGQLLVSTLPLFRDRRLARSNRSFNRSLIRQLLTLMDRDFDVPDAGIWEYRNRQQRHTYTYLFHWAGACAATRMAVDLNDGILRSAAEELALRARSRIEEAFVPSEGRFGQAIGQSAADASTLQLITLGYLDSRDPRALSHLRSLEKALSAPDGLFYRYRHDDDFGAPETTFLVTGFWRAEALACLGLLDEAEDAIRRLLACGNHLGLLSEDVSSDGSQWGNFPQTYSHVGLMNAVSRLARRLDRPFFMEGEDDV